jgi:hypothetical protein
MENQDSTGKSTSVTKWLALGITGAVLGITIYIAIYSLHSNGDKGDVILQTLIPLWGTWLGTVLAFYFGKNNFDAATKSYQAVIEKLTPNEKMAKLLVKDYMVPLNKIEYLRYDAEKDNKIYDILAYKRFEGYKRFAVFDNEGVAKYIIHRSLFDQFIASKVNEGMGIEDIKNLTLERFIKDSDEAIKDILKNSFAVVSIKASMLEAKVKMDSIPQCLDVFITETGAANERVEGLITNNIILKEANV